MGVYTGFLTLLVPLTVMGLLPPSPVLPGPGPRPETPPKIIPIDHQRCVAMRKETRRMPVPIPFFCHPRDPEGIPFPKVVDKDVTLMIMRLQWSGYKVCTRQMPMPTHRYIPVPVCCPGWQRGPTGKCDMPAFAPPPALSGPCLNGGILKKNGKCCQCPPGFSGALCQHTTRPRKPGMASPFPAARQPMDPTGRRMPPMPVRIRPPMNILSPPLRARIAQLLRSRQGVRSSVRMSVGATPPKSRSLPITPRVVKTLTENKNQQPAPRKTTVLRPVSKKPQSVPVNKAYINQLPRLPLRRAKPVVNTATINKVPRRPPPMARPPLNTAYINQLPKRPSAPPKVPANVAYINKLTERPVARPPMNRGNVNPYVNPRPLRITVNTAHINRVPRINPRPVRPVVNTAAINRIPTRIRQPVSGPRQTAYINRVPKVPTMNKPPPTITRIQPSRPRPVMAPPVVLAPRLGISPRINPTAINTVPPRANTPPRKVMQGIPPAIPVPRPPQSQPRPRPAQNRPSFASDDQCKQILEVGVTRCFRNAGILAAPRDVFNPQNPDVAQSICSQGKELKPCIMAGETACGRGMRVLITRRMLASLLSAMGNLCTSRPLPPPIRCINGGLSVWKDGKNTCQCPDGFGGDFCELPICLPACENNGLCENVDGSPKCVCTSGFYGDQCENAVAVTTVTDPKPVDPPTHSMETSPNPVPEPVKKVAPRPKDVHHEPATQQLLHDSHVAKMEIFGYPLWFVLAIALGILFFLLVIFITCCLCIRCRRSKRNFEVNKEAVKLPALDNVYTVGIVPPVYEAKGIPPLSYEEAKGETIKGQAKQLENKVEEEAEDSKAEEK